MEYSNADPVPEGGEYVCTSCGSVQEFETGDDFAICDSCGDDTARWEQRSSETAEDGLGEEES